MGDGGGVREEGEGIEEESEASEMRGWEMGEGKARRGSGWRKESEGRGEGEREGV